MKLPRNVRGTSLHTALRRLGYEISFMRYFYKPQPLGAVEEIRSAILVLERETEALLAKVVSA